MKKKLEIVFTAGDKWRSQNCDKFQSQRYLKELEIFLIAGDI